MCRQILQGVLLCLLLTTSHAADKTTLSSTAVTTLESQSSSAATGNSSTVTATSDSTTTVGHGELNTSTATEGESTTVKPFASTSGSSPESSSAENSTRITSLTDDPGVATTTVASSTNQTDDNSTPPVGSSTTVSSGNASITVTSEEPSASDISETTSTAGTQPPTSSTGSTVKVPTVPPSVTPTPEYPVIRPDSPFVLAILYGDSEEFAVYCTSGVCTYETVADDVARAFSIFPGFLYVRKKDKSASRQRRDVLFVAEIVIAAKLMIQRTEEERKALVKSSLSFLNATKSTTVTEKADTDIAAAFAKMSGDLCHAPAACPLSYTCDNNLCHHLCKDNDCGANGVCNAVIESTGTAKITCVCQSDSDYTYSGPKCDNREMSKDKKIAIVAGILGAFCAALVILVFILYCRTTGFGKDRTEKYQLGGCSNKGYGDLDIDMKSATSETL